ncbi:hypothetical protein ACVIWU_006576 [Bradyrhizobium sp. USDA 4509]
MAQELKRKGVTLTLLWQEYRTAHPDGYGYTWFCEKFDAYRRRVNPTFRHRHAAGAVMQTDYAGPTVEVIDPQTGEIRQAQIFVAVLGASSLTFAMGSFGQRLPDCAQWHDMIGEPTIADAILDRIIHNSHRIALEGDSMRRKKAARPLTDVENSETNIN